MAPLRTHELPDRSSSSVVGSSRRGDQIKKPDSRSPPRARPPGAAESAHRWPGLPPPLSRFLRRRFRIRNPARRCSDQPRRPFHPFR
ncbi:hypothetical protein GQ55_1G101700 [Panicum hallii var. hallii]|nr:hypothetical protein GQ55_1G101700 [Panicum hallii var. hallii]